MKTIIAILVGVLSFNVCYGAVQVTDFEDRVELNDLCSLREAVQSIADGSNEVEPACSGFGDHQILLKVGDYKLLGEITLNTDLTISGAGRASTAIKTDTDTGFSFIVTDSSVTFDNFSFVQINDGFAYAINNKSSDVAVNNIEFLGGQYSILNEANMVISDSSFNLDSFGVFNTGDLHIEGSLFFSNKTFGTNFITNLKGNSVINNTTIYNEFGMGGIIVVAGVVEVNYSTIITRDSTISMHEDENEALQPPVVSIYGNLLLDIEVNCQGSSTWGLIKSRGYNVMNTDGICPLELHETDVIDDSIDNSTLQLSKLEDHGGLTHTIAPTKNSIVVDAIPLEDCDPAITTDQRGRPRPSGSKCDIGAVELQPDDVVTIPEPIISVKSTTGSESATLTEPKAVNALAFKVTNTGDLDDVIKTMSVKFERLDGKALKESISGKLYVDVDADGTGDQLVGLFEAKMGEISIITPQLPQSIAGGAEVSYVVVLDFSTLKDLNTVVGFLLSPWLMNAVGLVVVRFRRRVVLVALLAIMVLNCGTTPGSKDGGSNPEASKYRISLTGMNLLEAGPITNLDIKGLEVQFN